MYAQVEKPKENKSWDAANFVAQNKSNVKHGIGFENNRSEAVVQRKRQEMTKSGQRIKQSGRFQKMRYNNPQTMPVNQLKKVLKEYPALQLQPREKIDSLSKYSSSPIQRTLAGMSTMQEIAQDDELWRYYIALDNPSRAVWRDRINGPEEYAVGHLRRDAQLGWVSNVGPGELAVSRGSLAAAALHSWERHTRKGISHVRALLSATSGDIAIFPGNMNLGQLNDLLLQVSDDGWRWNPDRSRFESKQTLGDIRVCLFANYVGGILHVTTAFPIDFTITREAAEALAGIKGRSAAMEGNWRRGK